MTKIILGLGAFALAALLVVGCGSGATDEPDTVGMTKQAQTCGGVRCTRPAGANGCVVLQCGTSPTTGKDECQTALVTMAGFSCECITGQTRACPSPSTVQQTCVNGNNPTTATTLWNPPC